MLLTFDRNDLSEDCQNLPIEEIKISHFKVYAQKAFAYFGDVGEFKDRDGKTKLFGPAWGKKTA